MRFKRVYIEITNVCNLSCPFCPPHNRENRFMSFEEFKLILSKIKGYTEYIYLHVKGEPLLHPEFDEFVKYANMQGFKINLTTNGTLLKNHLQITKYLRQINISLHATNSAEIVETAKKIDDCIINFRIWNIAQNPKAINLLEKEFDVKLDTSVENFTLAPNKFLSKENIFKWPDINDDEMSESGYCHALSSQIAILVDGTLVPCCLDNNGDIALGNIYLQELDEIIDSKRAQDMLKGFRNRKVTEELCKKCTYKLQF